MRKMQLKNIIIVEDYSHNMGGASMVARMTAEDCCAQGYNVVYFCCDKTPATDLDSRIKLISTKQGALFEANSLKASCFGIYNFKAFSMLTEILLQYSKEETIVHIHTIKALSISVYRAALKLGFKVVTTVHDYAFACPNGAFLDFSCYEICALRPLSFQCVCRNCDSRRYVHKIWRVIRQLVSNHIIKKNKDKLYWIFVSNFSKRIMEDYLDTSRGRVIYNPVKVNSSRDKVDAKENKFFGFVGRLEKEKGVDIFIEACDRADVEALVVGEGTEKGLFANQVRFLLTGWVDGEALNACYAKMRTLIFPSYCYETMGLVVLEALSRGIPVIVASNTVPTEFVENGKNGLIFTGRNVNDLVACIDQLKDNSLVERLGNNAYEIFWQSPFSQERYAKDLFTYYLELHHIK